MNINIVTNDKICYNLIALTEQILHVHINDTLYKSQQDSTPDDLLELEETKLLFEQFLDLRLAYLSLPEHRNQLPKEPKEHYLGIFYGWVFEVLLPTRKEKYTFKDWCMLNNVPSTIIPNI